uniref:FCP1 homology domain-containing protein n=1 Tax=Kalanchoe fedtschenkoi TaxID=63787 RepID=A0A7N0SVG8_KALFE
MKGGKRSKKPHIDAFLKQLAFYKIAVYSDQQHMYVNPNIARLDQKGLILYDCGHALETTLQLESCVRIKPWKLEAEDATLLDLIPFLESYIRPVLGSYKGHDEGTEFLKPSK